MRIGVLADVHGNLRALEAVLADLAKYTLDVVVNLGDHLSGPLQAAATADVLMAQSYVTIRGNHDRQLLDRPPEKMSPSDRAAHARIGPTHKSIEIGSKVCSRFVLKSAAIGTSVASFR